MTAAVHPRQFDRRELKVKSALKGEDYGDS
jgi:hypothetical protein